MTEAVNPPARGLTFIQLPPAVTPAEAAAALPDDRSYIEPDLDFTGWDFDSDFADETENVDRTPLLINDVRWAPFEVGSTVRWLRCDSEALDADRLEPAIDRVVAVASGIEEGSMVSGTFAWIAGQVDPDMVCWLGRIDGEEWFDLEPMSGRSWPEILEAFPDQIDWEPVADAARRAIAGHTDFDGVASDLDPEWSESLEISVTVDASIWLD